MIAGQIARNNLLLVEMAHLDRDISKELLSSRPAIQNDRLEGIYPMCSKAILPCRYTSMVSWVTP